MSYIIAVLWYPAWNHIPSCYYSQTELERYIIQYEGAEWPVDFLFKKDFADDSLKYHIDLEKTIEISDCPVKIVADLPYSGLKFTKLMKSLSTDNVEMVYLKDKIGFYNTTDDELLCLCQLDRLIKDNQVEGGEEDLIFSQTRAKHIKSNLDQCRQEFYYS